MDIQLPDMKKTVGKMNLACSGRGSWKRILHIDMSTEQWVINMDFRRGKVGAGNVNASIYL